MKKYVIWIGKNNEEVSKKVQEKLAEYGFQWNASEAIPSYAEASYITLNEVYRKMMYFFDESHTVDLIHKGFVLITPEYVFKYVETLDGAVKKVVKKMTVAEIAKELGYDVEVVKG